MTEIREVTEFYRKCADMAGDILADPVAYAVASAARQAVGELQAHSARLQAELDRYQGRTVFFTTDAMLASAAAHLGGAARPGDFLRATDTGRELRCNAIGEWEPVT